MTRLLDHLTFSEVMIILLVIIGADMCTRVLDMLWATLTKTPYQHGFVTVVYFAAVVAAAIGKRAALQRDCT